MNRRRVLGIVGALALTTVIGGAAAVKTKAAKVTACCCGDTCCCGAVCRGAVAAALSVVATLAAAIPQWRRRLPSTSLWVSRAAKMTLKRAAPPCSRNVRRSLSSDSERSLGQSSGRPVPGSTRDRLRSCPKVRPREGRAARRPAPTSIVHRSAALTTDPTVPPRPGLVARVASFPADRGEALRPPLVRPFSVRVISEVNIGVRQL